MKTMIQNPRQYTKPDPASQDFELKVDFNLIIDEVIRGVEDCEDPKQVAMERIIEIIEQEVNFYMEPLEV